MTRDYTCGRCRGGIVVVVTAAIYVVGKPGHFTTWNPAPFQPTILKVTVMMVVMMVMMMIYTPFHAPDGKIQRSFNGFTENNHEIKPEEIYALSVSVEYKFSSNTNSYALAPLTGLTYILPLVTLLSPGKHCQFFPKFHVSISK